VNVLVAPKPSHLGDWSIGPPPYLRGVDEASFNRMKAEWLGRIMRKPLIPSCRVVAYFIADQLNWATMDCWASHGFTAQQAKVGEKTIQRSIGSMEHGLLLSVFRARGTRNPLRYAPLYGVASKEDAGVQATGHPRPLSLVVQDHVSFLETRPESSLGSLSGISNDLHQPSFDRAERINLEFEVARLLGGRDQLSSLALIDDEIVTRLCEAFATKQFTVRQVRAASLAANQLRRR
jgi:hypothetical protein